MRLSIRSLIDAGHGRAGMLPIVVGWGAVTWRRIECQSCLKGLYILRRQLLFLILLRRCGIAGWVEVGYTPKRSFEFYVCMHRQLVLDITYPARYARAIKHMIYVER